MSSLGIRVSSTNEKPPRFDHRTRGLAAIAYSSGSLPQTLDHVAQILCELTIIRIRVVPSDERHDRCECECDRYEVGNFTDNGCRVNRNLFHVPVAHGSSVTG